MARKKYNDGINRDTLDQLIKEPGAVSRWILKAWLVS